LLRHGCSWIGQLSRQVLIEMARSRPAKHAIQPVRKSQ
jgi:hypothetical protein